MTTRRWVADADPTAREHFVYRVFDANGYLLYIGRTKSPRSRWGQHQRDRAAWMEFAASCRMVGPLDYLSAHRLERELIVRECPAYNKRGTLGTTDPRSIVNYVGEVQA